MNDIRKVLSYNDVLLCPRHSDLEHLTDANIYFNYDKCSIPFIAIPLINAPMDTVCSPNLINFMSHNFSTTIHRWFKSTEEQIKYYKESNPVMSHSTFISVGNVSKWQKEIDMLLKYREENDLWFGILIDVANGDTTTCIDTLKYIKSNCKSKINVMAGNIATRSAFARLQDAGADFIRCGIGGGCFTPDMKVGTTEGYKKIKDIRNGDMVFTHTGNAKEVIGILNYETDEILYKINDIECTANHEFYVIDKKFNDVINDRNIHQCAKWIKAEDLNFNCYHVGFDAIGYYKVDPIINISKFSYKGELFDLTVKDDHSYNINSMIVHNSVCTTRTTTGFGIPTLTSVMDCAKVKDSAYLVADGGIEHNGDICKAIVAGADMVMIGKVLASTNLASSIKYDCNKELTNDPEKFYYCGYRGMASKISIETLNSSKTAKSIEGGSGMVKYKGTTEEVINQIIGNLRSAMAYYGGCTTWADFQKKIKFLEITTQGWKESETRFEG